MLNTDTGCKGGSNEYMMLNTGKYILKYSNQQAVTRFVKYHTMKLERTCFVH